jgi:hypothetical protein
MITHDELKKLLHYNPETGIFTWRIRLSFRTRVGAVAGCRRSNGSFYIRIHGLLYLAHRLAWLYMTGAFPKQVIDHINRDPWDNRWANLRACSQAENSRNTKVSRNNTSGISGVSRGPQKKEAWAAHIMINRRKIHLGYYATIEEAGHARRTAEETHFGAFAP